jgi:FMN hydrolase / 5-amino-6-(5-phospho-D-ribitylamino)uracil phosphatase
MNIDRIKAISLDLDDTLWPIGPTLVRAEEALRSWFRAHAPKALVLYEDQSRVALLRAQIVSQRAHALHEISAIRKELIHEVLRLSGESTSGVEEAFAVFFQARQKVDLYDDSLHALERMKSRFPLLALSNGNADLSQVGLGHLFEHAVSAERFGVAKPDVKIFQHSAALLGLPCSEILHIGDDLQTDVQGASQAGMQCAWINRHGQEPSAEPNCLSFSSLLPLCEMLGV